MKLYYGYLTRSTILQILQTLEKKDYQTFDSPPHPPNKKRDKDTIDSFYFLRTWGGTLHLFYHGKYISFYLLLCLLQREEQGNEKDGGGQRRVRNRVRGKGRGRSQYHHNHNNNHNHGNHVGTPPSSSSTTIEQAGTMKQQPPGPRMPDGTRGFVMGRGKPVSVNMAWKRSCLKGMENTWRGVCLSVWLEERVWCGWKLSN